VRGCVTHAESDVTEFWLATNNVKLEHTHKKLIKRMSAGIPVGIQKSSEVFQNKIMEKNNTM